MERPQARKTGYVGVLQDSKRRGFWLLLWATPIGGGPSPAGRKTIAARGDRRAIETLWPGGDRPVGSYLGFLQDLEAARVSFVLSPESGDSPEVSGLGRPGIGRARKWSIGMWGTRSGRSLGAGSRRTPRNRMDLQRMKIDATFRDRKDRRGLKPRMNPSQESMEKMVALLYRAPRGGESEGLPVRAAAFGVEGTRRVSRPAGAGQPGSPGHPFPRARESSGPAPAKPVALLRSVRTPHAEVVRDASAVAGHRPGGFGFLPPVPTHVRT